MDVKLISITKPEIDGLKTAEELIAYCARVSNPSNQMNTETAPRLIKYLIKNKHWSPFEMASMCVGIETSRAIAAQILRHRSFSFQEFSQRYAASTDFEFPEIRKAGSTNRQSSKEPINDMVINQEISWVINESFRIYEYLINNGIATETARMVLPLSTKTKLYMNGTVRSWIHYIDLRTDEHTQKEHRLIAEKIKEIFIQQFPAISEALNYGV